jgi:hypothetical protein
VSKDTVRCWETYAAAHFIPFFETGEGLCSEARLADYMRYRLTRVKPDDPEEGAERVESTIRLDG